MAGIYNRLWTQLLAAISEVERQQGQGQSSNRSLHLGKACRNMARNCAEYLSWSGDRGKCVQGNPSHSCKTKSHMVRLSLYKTIGYT